MSVTYTWVGWNRHKKVYDGVVLSAVAVYLGVCVGIGLAADEPASVETLLMRAFGTGAMVLLHIVLWIGPAARLSPALLPLLYNRRHLGVMTFGVGLIHGVLALLRYHGFGNVNPLLSLLAGNTNYGSLGGFPFEVLGLGGLLVLFLMAATSHDFWLKNLSPMVWKWLHMLVYAAYAMLVMHVVLGFLQSERSPVLAGLVSAGAVVTVCLHLLAGRREVRRDGATVAGPDADGFVDVCGVDDIAENRARVVCVGGDERERIAVFRYDGKVSAVSNVCEHQGGPLGEGKVIEGCITCPWHGYQYRPGDGCSPAPFTERIATYEVRVAGRRIRVNPRANPKGTAVRPALIEGEANG